MNDVSGLYGAAYNAMIQSKISYEIAGKQLDAMKMVGDAAVDLVQDAAELGKSIETGKLLDLLG